LNIITNFPQISRNQNLVPYTASWGYFR